MCISSATNTAPTRRPRSRTRPTAARFPRSPGSEYDAPQNIVKDSPFSHYADDGAPAYNRFLDGLDASRTVESDPHRTAIGHGYCDDRLSPSCAPRSLWKTGPARVPRVTAGSWRAPATSPVRVWSAIDQPTTRRLNSAPLAADHRGRRVVGHLGFILDEALVSVRSPMIPAGLPAPYCSEGAG